MIRYCSTDQLVSRITDAADGCHWLAEATAYEYAAVYGREGVSLGGASATLRVSDFGLAVIGSLIHGLVVGRKEELDKVKAAGEQYRLTAGKLVLSSAQYVMENDVIRGDMLWAARAAMSTGPGCFLTSEELFDDQIQLGPAWQNLLDDEARKGVVFEIRPEEALKRLLVTGFLWEGWGEEAEDKYCFRPHLICDDDLGQLVHSADMASLWKE